MTPVPSRAVLPGPRSAVSSALCGARSVVRGAGFWAAILLPALYLPLMLMNHPWMVDVANIAKVLALHAASLFVGRDHGSSLSRE